MTTARALLLDSHLARLGLVLSLWICAGIAPTYASCSDSYTVPTGIYNFDGACARHKVCYGICGKSRSECDSLFSQDMMNVCETIRARYNGHLNRAEHAREKIRETSRLNVPVRLYWAGRLRFAQAQALATLPHIGACRTAAQVNYRLTLNLGSGDYCAAQEKSMCCPQNIECVDEYECPEEEPPATAIGTDYGTVSSGDVSPAHTASLQAFFTGATTGGESSTPTTTGTVIWVGTDQSQFCKYTPENMTPVPVGGGTATANGGGTAITTNGGTANGGGSNGGSTTGNGGTATTNGGTATTNGGGTSGGGTITGTPGTGTNGGDDPSDADEPEEKTPEKIYVNIKATATNVAAGAQATSISTMHVKLFPTVVANPALPGNGAKKDTSTGAGDDPAQALTDANGEATIGIAGGAFGLGQEAANGLSVAVNLDPTVTAVMTDAGQLIPGYTKPDEIYTIDGETFWVFYVPESTATALAPDGTIEIVLCIIKKPVGAHEYEEFEPPPPFSRLPGATISFGEAQGAL